MARLQALSRVQPLAPAEAFWLVGFLEAEAHFYVAPNNGGANWRCGVGVAVRDDDADILLDLCRRTALGRVRPVRARGNSHPQACWTIDCRLETQRLAAVLSKFPPAGRRRHEVREWVAAVGVLSTRRRGTSPMDWQGLARHAERMADLRKFTPGRAPPAQLAMRSSLFLAWLGGFFTGEGSLMLEPTRARLAIHLRRDDLSLLEAIRDRLGIGAVYDMPAQQRGAPSATWAVFARAEVREAVSILARSGLRGRKAREFAAWEAGVYALGDPSPFRAARAKLAEERCYVPPSELPYTSRAVARAHEGYIEALRRWAVETQGPLTCTAYGVARRAHPDWPTRNTVVLNFGSWAAALEAAGLRHRAHARSAV